MSRRGRAVTSMVAVLSLLATGLTMGPVAAVDGSRSKAEFLVRTAVARAAEAQAPNTVMRVTSTSYIRHRPEARDRADPYHLDMGRAIPEQTTITTWTQFGVDGRAEQIRSQIRNADDRLLQDSLSTSTQSLTYDALRDETIMAAGQDLSQVGQAGSSVALAPGERPVSAARTGSRNGRAFLTTEFSPQLISPEMREAQRSMAFAAPYLADLDAMSVTREADIATDNGDVLATRLVAVDPGGTRTVVVEQQVQLRELVAPPATIFSSSAIPGRRVEAASSPITLSPVRSVDMAEAAKLLGEVPLVLGPSSTFDLDRIIAGRSNDALQNIPFAYRDLLFATKRGEAVTLQYKNDNGAVISLREGPATKLKASAQQSRAGWSISRIVSVVWEGQTTSAWLLQYRAMDRPEARLIMEIGDLLLDLHGVGVTEQKLLQAATTLGRAK